MGMTERWFTTLLQHVNELRQKRGEPLGTEPAG